jgi:hypothetical protein
MLPTKFVLFRCKFIVIVITFGFVRNVTFSFILSCNLSIIQRYKLIAVNLRTLLINNLIFAWFVP